MRTALIFLLFITFTYGEIIVLDVPQKSSDRFTSTYNTLIKEVKNSLKNLEKKEKSLKDINALLMEYDRLLKKVSVEKILAVSRYKEYEDATINALKDLGVSAENLEKIYNLFQKAENSLVKSLDALEEFLLYKKKKFQLLKNSSFKIENGKIIFSDKQSYRAYIEITKNIKKAFNEYQNYSKQFIQINKQIIKKVNEFAG
ncbi:hypothetical protein SAMN06265182_0035 [Persephonella hydrogeniphila]|uniref:Uncharacterized protein n=1 Tax=Persephonella hydrogeniphila TaxID=198703 RepID=A0A285MYA9_9AQUI|nr:hypothetical protein [Persephonella hydrogeniphila]SNZ02164.1 hypothetical protein SAMN06265182_0035 [Persephonella hydrogeniphila]